MNLIAIDTSTEIATVAVSKGGDIQSIEQPGVRQHAQHLLPMLQSLLQKQQMIWQDIEGIVFGSGPGSFTGLRIACSIAKALAYAHHLPLYGVSSMQAIAYQMRDKLSQTELGILVGGDARMQELYWAYYAPGMSLLSAEAQVTAVREIQITGENPIVLAGWGLEHYQQQWSPGLQQRIIAEYAMYPRADMLIRMVQVGEGSLMTAEHALPLYIRNDVTHSRGSHG